MLVVGEPLPSGDCRKSLITEKLTGNDRRLRKVVSKTTAGFLRSGIRKICLLEKGHEQVYPTAASGTAVTRVNYTILVTFDDHVERVGKVALAERC